MSLSKQTIELVKATAGVVAPVAGEITTRFYKNMFAANPEVLSFFNKTNQSKGGQPEALSHAVVAYAQNIENLGALGPAVELIAAKHCGLQVLPHHYPIVEKHFMGAVGEVLGDAVTPEIGGAWSEALHFLSNILITREEELYKDAEEREGGWRGWQSFSLTDRSALTANTALFTFERSDGNKTPFAFTPGQFLTLRAKGVSAPRHYTIVSSPGESFLQCAVKLVNDGAMSTLLHRDLAVGNAVEVSPPFGGFAVDTEKDAVLISAGIGVTPVVALQNMKELCVKRVVHVDKTPDSHAFLDIQNKAPSHRFFYTQGAGEPFYYLVNEIASAATNGIDGDAAYYVCGPPPLMRDIKKSLHTMGVDDVRCEMFGP
jgi:nitric oxide dioxygenase